MGIERIDKNFARTNEQSKGMKEYKIPCQPFDLYGIFYDEKIKCFLRMDYSVSEKVSANVHYLNCWTTGGRIRFRTNAKKIGITATYKYLEKMPHMTLLASSGFVLLEGQEKEDFQRGCLNPTLNDENGFHASCRLSGEMKNYMLYFPLYNDVESLSIQLDEDAVVEKGNIYRDVKPILYYGSSITEGGCASRPDTCYPALISKWNNIDFINLGFSGNCLGEIEMAEYLAQQECSLFVCDYDHNAPNVEHLEKSHYRLYEIFRSKQKDTPILFLTKPDVRSYDWYKQFRNVVYRTYRKAKAQGDNNVYFIDGKSYYGEADCNICAVDGCHSNDLGFYKMAKKIYTKMIRIDKNFK